MRFAVPLGGGRSPLALIWFEFVKRTVLLLSEKFHFFFRLFFPLRRLLRRMGHRLLDRVRDRNALTAVIKAEMRESTRARLHGSRSYQQNTVRRGVWA